MGAESSFICAIIQIKEDRTFSCTLRHTPMSTVTAANARDRKPGLDLKALSPRNAGMNV